VTRGLSLVAVAAALALLGIALSWYELRPAPKVIRAPIDETESLAPPAFSFTPAEQVRAVPALQFTDAEGRDLSLADFRGRVILLNIWATWCVPCRREMPTLDRLQTKLGSADFEVLALSIDRQGLAAIKPFFSEVGVKALRIYVDKSGKAAQMLDIVGLPTTLLIDRMGRERGRFAGPAAWDSAGSIETIRRYLSESSGLSDDGLHMTASHAIQRMTES
jgi:thiol-disulfide isomerase/thioredoxin